MPVGREQMSTPENSFLARCIFSHRSSAVSAALQPRTQPDRNPVEAGQVPLARIRHLGGQGLAQGGAGTL